jgi:hypothetical protein
MKTELQILERLNEVKETWNRYYEEDFAQGKDPYMNLTTDSLMSAAQVESEITTLEWILDKEYSSKHIEQL